MSDEKTELRPESPLNVSVSKDVQDPTMKQIADDALAYAKDLSFKIPKRHVDYAAGAIRQDRIATNRAVELCIKTIWDMRPLIDGGTEFLPGNEFSHAKWNALSEAVKELEKLRI